MLDLLAQITTNTSGVSWETLAMFGAGLVAVGGGSFAVSRALTSNDQKAAARHSELANLVTGHMAQTNQRLQHHDQDLGAIKGKVDAIDVDVNGLKQRAAFHDGLAAQNGQPTWRRGATASQGG